MIYLQLIFLVSFIILCEYLMRTSKGDSGENGGYDEE